MRGRFSIQMLFRCASCLLFFAKKFEFYWTQSEYWMENVSPSHLLLAFFKFYLLRAFSSIFFVLLRNQRAKPIIIDPGLYLSKKFDLALATEHRELPSTFKLFTGMCLWTYLLKYVYLFFYINSMISGWLMHFTCDLFIYLDMIIGFVFGKINLSFII